jgi:hypothetical protein
LFDAYDDFDDAGGDDEDIGRGYGDGVHWGPIDGGNNDSSNDEFDDGNSYWLVGKGVGNLRDGEKISKGEYIRAI